LAARTRLAPRRLPPPPHRSRPRPTPCRRDSIPPSPPPPLVTPSLPLTAASPILLRTPARALYYTLDGTDPRLPGGTPNPAAFHAAFAAEAGGSTTDPILVAPAATWKYWDLGTDPGPTWPLPGHDDSAWLSGPAQLGYGDADEATVVRFVDADAAQSGIQRNATTYFRTAFPVPDPAVFESFTLEVTYDDAVAVYLNGREILRTDNLPAGADFRTYATADRADNTVESLAGLPVNLLRPGTNWIAAEVHQRNASSSDLSFALGLVGVPRAGVDPTGTWNTAAPLFLARPTRILARSWNGTAWSALTDARIVPDARPAESASLLISEIAYRPPDATTPAELAVTRDRDEFEFVELLNVGNEPLDLADIRLAGGVEFDLALAPGSLGVLAPGARVLLVANRAAFEARYGPGLPVAGEFRGHLGNEGDSLRLETRNGTVLHRLAWTPTAPWPSTTDAPDRSLVLIRPESRPNLADPAQWRASTQPGGNPGASDTMPFAGRPEADLDGNGQADLVDYAVGNPDGGLRITLVKPEASAGFLRLEHARKPAADAAPDRHRDRRHGARSVERGRPSDPRIPRDHPRPRRPRTRIVPGAAPGLRRIQPLLPTGGGSIGQTRHPRHESPSRPWRARLRPSRTEPNPLPPTAPFLATAIKPRHPPMPFAKFANFGSKPGVHERAG
jgi:hypothetical protein